MEPVSGVTSVEEKQAPRQPERAAVAEGETLICVKCGNQAFPLHRGCKLCEDCCDCRPLGT